MAGEGAPVSIGSASYEWMAGVRDTLAREIAAALRTERERCAVICESHAGAYPATAPGTRTCAREIRAGVSWGPR